MLKLSGVRVQVAGLVTTPGGSWDGNQVLWKLQDIVLKVAGGSWGGDHVEAIWGWSAGDKTCYSTWRK